jgi:hypothetical protein
MRKQEHIPPPSYAEEEFSRTYFLISSEPSDWGFKVLVSTRGDGWEGSITL